MKILIAGDFAPCRSIQDAYLNGARNFFEQEILDALKNADLRLINLELPLTNTSNAIKKVGPNLKAAPALIELLLQPGFDVACMANNHIFDYGEEGLRDTLDACAKHGIATVGAGLDLEQAGKTLYREIKERTIAIINFSENEFCNASEMRGGANPMDLIDNTYQIQEARKKADIVLVIVHGGHEQYHYPSPRMVKQYRFYVEQGADAVVAHHTHCIGPYETYNGKPIIYSLGNFMFPSTATSSGWHEGYMVRLSFTDAKEVEIEVIPYQQCGDKGLGVQVLDVEQTVMFEKKMSALCATLANPDNLREKWEDFVQMQQIGRLGRLLMLGRWPFALWHRLPFLERLLSRHKLRVLHNCIRCEAHLDLSQAVLDLTCRDSKNKTRQDQSKC